MNQRDHLSLAVPNSDLARTLAESTDESSFRSSVVAAFYAAHHFPHALFDRFSVELPADEVRGGRFISHVHPGNHSQSAGGTRGGLCLLARRHDDLDIAGNLITRLLDQSYSARYGRLIGGQLARFSVADARLSLHQLDRVISIISPYLR